MPQSNEAIVNDALNMCSDMISNMGKFSNVPADCPKHEGFAEYSKLFCDSIVFWGLWNATDESSKGRSIGKHISVLREIFANNSLEIESIKPISSGFLYLGSVYFSNAQIQKCREECNTAFTPGYIAIKVSLHDCSVKKLMKKLEDMLSTIRDKDMTLHDVDFTHDCKYISTRLQITKHLEEHGVHSIINDRNRVGDHCVSWMGNTEETQNIRHKVYNKFIQMLECAEVRKSLGSRMENLVLKEGKFARRLERYKNYGYTRLELTFYGPELLTYKEYRRHMRNAQDLLSGCTTYECPFKKQWKQRAQNITSMVAVYFPKKKVFAYCHWWNSVTSKKYGYMWEKVQASLVPLLLANYSFNNRPIYYHEFKLDRSEVPYISKKVTYQRESGSTAITLVPGGAKGMYPSRSASPTGVRKFSKVGIIEVDNIKIAWPKSRHDRRNAPLADIVEVDEDDEEGIFIRKLKVRNTSLFKAVYNVLEPNTQYTVVAAGYAKYRQAYYIHFITECGLKIRAAKSLTKVWDSWRKQFEDRRGYIDIPMVPHMTFTAVQKIRSQGSFDMKCRLDSKVEDYDLDSGSDDC